MKLKKIIGSLGRRYGGEPFRIIRKFCYDALEIPARFSPVNEIRGKHYKQSGRRACMYDTDEFSFYNLHYTAGKSDNVKEGIICMFDGSLAHGGITDRIRGILTTWQEAKRRGTPFYIHWTHPFRLDTYLIPAEADWRIDDSEVSRLRGDAFPVMIEETSMFHTHLENRLRLKAALKNALPQTHVYTNADNSRGKYSSLYKELFRPSPLLQNALDTHLEVLGTGFYAFSFRFIGLLGDFTDNAKTELPHDEAEMLIRKVTDEFMSLAMRVPAQKKILITSDSPRFLRHISATEPRIYIVPGDVQHTDYAQNAGDDLWLKTFVDQHLLMHASRITLMRTGKMYKSGFPRFAAEVGGVEFIDHQF
ncbi:MAG: hypothetical protein K1V90_09120 [Muribaculaceae bacterium]|jgi:hypothetical protein